MPIVTRVTQTPPLNQILAIEQIIIVDQTGPAIVVGGSPGASCLVGEFLKGPFDPTEVFSGGDVDSTYGALSGILSQDIVGSTAVQNGSGGALNGNGRWQLQGKTFQRLVIQRADTEAVTADGGAVKGQVTVTVTVAAADQMAGVTNKDLIVPAGTRFGDDALALATEIVALSQDLLIPAGSVVAANLTTANANVMFIKGFHATGATTIDTVIDTTVVGGSSGTFVSAAAQVPADLWAPGTGANLKARIESVYPDAVTKTLPGSPATDDIVVIWAARTATGVRTALQTNVGLASKTGRGRMACVSGDPADAATSAAAAAAKAAVKALSTGFNDDRMSVNFPHVQVFSSLLGANRVISPDGFKASRFALLPEEFQSSVADDQQQGGTIQFIVAPEPAFAANPLTVDDLISMKANGVSCLVRDRSVGWWFQSAVTSSTDPTRAFDNRRRFADFVQDTLTGIAAKYNKKPGTTERVETMLGEFDVFLSGLKSVNNPSLQRIEDYSIGTSSNTPQLTGAGVRFVDIAVRMLGDLNDIILLTKIGPTVEISQTA